MPHSQSLTGRLGARIGRGEAGAFTVEGPSEPGGTGPVNTNGGGMSYTGAGMYGMRAARDTVRQLRGEAAARLPGVRTCFARGMTGSFMAASFVLSGGRPGARG